jgi:hypothetical protein
MMQLRMADRRPPTYAKGPLLDWLRSISPDLRIMRGLVDGCLVVAIRFTWNGAVHEYNARLGAQPNGATILDPEDAVIRTACVAVMRQLGMPTAGRRLNETEQQILAATARGDSEHADRLSRDLVLDNQQELRLKTQTRSRFGRRQAW